VLEQYGTVQYSTLVPEPSRTTLSFRGAVQGLDSVLGWGASLQDLSLDLGKGAREGGPVGSVGSDSVSVSGVVSSA
jgi:hypothetical protein